MQFKKVISSLAAAAVIGSALAVIPAGAADATAVTVYRPYTDNLISNKTGITGGSKILEENYQADWKDTDIAYVYIGDVKCSDIRSVTIGYGFNSTTTDPSSVKSTANFYATTGEVTSSADFETVVNDTSETKKFASAAAVKSEQWGAVYYKLGLDDENNAVLTSVAHTANKMTGTAENVEFSIPEAGNGVIVEIPLVNGEVYIDNIQLETALSEDDILTYGTDYTCAAYFSEGSLVTDTAEFDPTTETGVALTRAETEDSKCLAYMVLDISGVSVKGASWTANDSVRLYTTDNDAIKTTAPKDMAKSGSFDLQDTDWTRNSAGTALNENNGLKQVYGLEFIGQFSESSTKNLNISGSKYLVVLFNKWGEASTYQNFKLYGTSTAAAKVTIDGAETAYSTFSEALAAANGKTATVTLYKDVEVNDGSSIVNPAANTDITINAAENTNVTIKRTGTAKGAMIRADKNSDNGNADGARKITLGVSGGSLVISDEVTSGVTRDQGTFMLGGDTFEEAITLGSKVVVNQVSGDYTVFNWKDREDHTFTVDGADLSAITNKYISSTNSYAAKANVVIKNAAKLGELKLNTEKSNVDLIGYTGAAIPLTIDGTLTEGLIIADGSPDKLSFVNDSFVLTAGTGENAGKIVLAVKSGDIKAIPLDGNGSFEDGSMGWTATLTLEDNKSVNIQNPKWIISNAEGKTTSVSASVSDDVNITITGGSYVFGIVLTQTAINNNTIDDVWFSY